LMLPVQLEPNQGPVECHKGVLQMLRNKRDISHSHTFIKISQKQLSTHLRVVALPFRSTKGLLLHLQFNLSATHPIRPVQPSPWLTDGSAGKGPCIWTVHPVPVVIPDCLGGRRYPNCHVKIPSPPRHSVQTTGVWGLGVLNWNVTCTALENSHTMA
jgi:hypothetical protein